MVLFYADNDGFVQPTDCGFTDRISGPIPSAAVDVGAVYFIESDTLGLKVLFDSPQGIICYLFILSVFCRLTLSI